MNGFIDETKIGFIKNNDYVDQNEYRLIIEMDKNYPGVQKFNIGDIRDICHVVPIERLSNIIQIKLKP